MNPNRTALTRLDMMSRAQIIARSLGIRSAAGYLRGRGFSIEAALTLLVYLAPLRCSR